MCLCVSGSLITARHRHKCVYVCELCWPWRRRNKREGHNDTCALLLSPLSRSLSFLVREVCDISIRTNTHVRRLCLGVHFYAAVSPRRLKRLKAAAKGRTTTMQIYDKRTNSTVSPCQTKCPRLSQIHSLAGKVCTLRSNEPRQPHMQYERKITRTRRHHPRPLSDLRLSQIPAPFLKAVLNPS